MALTCGTGSASHVLGALYGRHPSWDIHVVSLSDRGRAFEDAAASSGVRCVESVGPDEVRAWDGRPAVAGPSQLPALVGRADLVLMAMPAYGHEVYLRAMLPHLTGKTTLVVLPAYGGADLLVEHLVRASTPSPPRGAHVLLVEQLPWVCRVATFGREVRLLAHKREVGCVALGFDGEGRLTEPEPARVTEALEWLSVAYRGRLRRAAGAQSAAALALSVFNPNAIMHAALLSGFHQAPDGRGRGRRRFVAPPPFYGECEDGAVARLAAVDREVLRVKAALLEHEPPLRGALELVRSFHEWIRGAYRDSIADPSTIASCLRTNAATRSLVHPMVRGDDGMYAPDLRHRYLTEDVPYGLLPLKGIASLVGTPTPALDEIIEWAQGVMGTSWLRDGTLTEGAWAPPHRLPQRFGVDTLEGLRRRYRRPSAPITA